MISDRQLVRAAHTALGQCLAVQAGEKLLIVSNPEYQRICEALYNEGVKLGADTALVYYPKGEINGEEPPPLIANAMLKSDVVVAPTVASITHTSARRKACKAGARVATMPGISEDFFVRGLSANHDELIAITKDVFQLLDKAQIARVTSPSGTDLTLDIRNKARVSDGDLRARGAFSNLPTGESELAPKTARGVLVADRCAHYITEPTELEINKGYITKYEGHASGRRFKRLIEQCCKMEGNRNASFVAEFAIGTNKKAKLSGIILEEEKKFGTCHIAFGDNTSYSGGRNASTLHIDTIVLNPTIMLDGRTVMKNGKLTI